MAVGQHDAMGRRSAALCACAAAAAAGAGRERSGYLPAAFRSGWTHLWMHLRHGPRLRRRSFSTMVAVEEPQTRYADIMTPVSLSPTKPPVLIPPIKLFYFTIGN